jgi:multidrug transporter EmrE-like cation transporter
MAAGLRFNTLSGVLSALIMWAISGFRIEWSAFSLGMAFALSLCCLSYSLLSFQVLKEGDMTLYSTFLMSGGMTVPYVYGILFLGEDPPERRTIGIVLLIGAVALSNFKGKGERVKLGNILMCIAVFFLNGFVSVTSKVHQEGFGAFAGEASGVFPHVDTAHFVMLSGIAKVAVCGSVLLILTLIGYIKAKKSAPVSDNSGIDSGSD